MTSTTDKHQILEPITAVSRLITLAFKPKNTKIAIRDHNIVLCEPKTDNYLGIKIPIPQSVDRYWNGDSREDIYILNHVICNFIEWYIIPYRSSDPSMFKGLINMAKYLRVALKDLQMTYRTGNVVGTLQYYINVLTALIDNTFHIDMLYNPLSSGRYSFLDENNEDPQNPIYSTIFDVQKLKSFWTREELQSLCNQFDQCFKLPEDPDTVIFRDNNVDDTPISHTDINDDANCSEDNYVDFDNDQTQRRQKPQSSYIKNTSYKSWPVPRSQTNVIVQGHLVAISNILNMMDKRFTAMLNQSVKGTH